LVQLLDEAHTRDATACVEEAPAAVVARHSFLQILGLARMAPPVCRRPQSPESAARGRTLPC
jgi:hypothetical protein